MPKNHEILEKIPFLPLRDIVMYPHMVAQVFITRIESVKALERSLAKDKPLFLVTQRSAKVKKPGFDDLYDVGVTGNALQLLQLPNNTLKILLEGKKRARVKKFGRTRSFISGSVQILHDEIKESEHDEVAALVSTLRRTFKRYARHDKNIPRNLFYSFSEKDDDIGKIVDIITIHLPLSIENRQKVLTILNIRDRLLRLIELLESELTMIELDARVIKRMEGKLENTHRRFYLTEQISAIKEELNELDGGINSNILPTNDVESLEEKIKKSDMTQEARKKALSEYEKLKKIPELSPESTIVLSYIDCLIDVPWKKCSPLKHALKESENILERDHYGLKKVKERILEYLAVQKRIKQHNRGIIFCLVGPPGVGKTSLGESIADATGRKFIRVSLGGVRDEAEIRGHRRTYVGAMPGKVIQKIIKVKVANPVFMLDEIDKMGMDSRGDPASALLEVLDPEQNKAFDDHYLEVSYDLSRVMFIATANSLNIPKALLDRMEIIRLPGYTEQEKLLIAKQYIVPKQLKKHGLNKKVLNLSDGVLLDIIRYYTREAGLRNLEREVAKLSRKVVRKIAESPDKKQMSLTRRHLEAYLGVKRYKYGLANSENQIGQVMGLAWSEAGGDLLIIEAVALQGSGKLVHTGSLGDVMQESIQAALTVARSYQKNLKLSNNYFQKHDIHIHVPEGAIPKDGPSAGIGMCTAMMSMLSKIPVYADVAMTGEVTLQGKLLAIGGLKEKLLAASRGGIKRVIIPEENTKDLVDIPKEIKTKLKIFPMKHIEDVWKLTLVKPIKALRDN